MLWILFFLVILGPGVLCEYPDCFHPDLSWPNWTNGIPNVETPFLCQSACQNSPSCSGFTWLQDTHPTYPHVCLVFNQTTGQVPLSDCISGPRSCTCSSEGSCVSIDNNVLEIMSGLETELECQQLCFEIGDCTRYTWDTEGFFEATCFLFSSCSVINEECQGCFNGPPSCSSISTSTTGPWPTTSPAVPTSTISPRPTTSPTSTISPWPTTSAIETTTGHSNGGEFAVIIGGYPSLVEVEVWSPDGHPQFNNIPDFPETFSSGFAFWTKSEHIIVSNDDTIHSWNPSSDVWTQNESRSSVMDGPNACLLSDNETIIFPAADDAVYVDYFSMSGGWTKGQEVADRNLGGCLLSIPGMQEIIFTGGSSRLGFTSHKTASVLNEDGYEILGLPDMNFGRSDHGCTYTSYHGNPGILVTGGGTKGGTPATRRDTVEFLPYKNIDHSGDKWMVLEPLPYSVYKGVLRTINTVPYLFGGIIGNEAGNDHTDIILMFDEAEEIFKQVGNMKNPRVHHSVAIVKQK